MHSAKRHHKAGTWPETRTVSNLTLPLADRHRRRLVIKDDEGKDFLLDLMQATLLGDGDGLELEDGTFIRIKAALEDVIEVTCKSPEAVARIAWAIGNRHTDVQILHAHPLPLIRLLWDHVLADMLEGMGAEIRRIQAPFHPESGAYATVETTSYHHHHD